MRYALAMGISLFVVAACSSGGDPVALTDVMDVPGGQDVSMETVADLAVETTLPELEEEPDLRLPELPNETIPECQPGDGCFLDPCDSNDDCLSGLCVGHLGGKVCTIACVEECPDGWSCQQIGSGPDMNFACVSPYTHLCRPCQSAQDCIAPTGVEDVCVAYGPQGAFCGADCSGSGLCPAGYSCVDAVTVAGGAVKQCVADAGVCACSETSKKLGLTTSCYLENEFGTCTGLRSCGPEGLTECSAAEPGEEFCDGLDNDCNDVVDDLSCDDGDPCTADSCDPAVGCVHEALNGTTCDDGDVCTLADHCENGACIGTEINCDDNNVCTTDSCNPTGGCVYSFNNAPCDDEDPCTVNDHCAQGSCTGYAVPCECQEDQDCLALEDGDLCNGTLYCNTEAFPQACEVDPDTVVACPDPTGPDAACLAAACDPFTGACGEEPANDGFLCDDGDPCTVAEHCDGGICTGGVPVVCNDGNPCTQDACTDGECTYEPTAGACDDGNACTVGDHCAQGLCVYDGLADCDDGNVCTADSCSPASGCFSAALDGVVCDDGDPCTTGDSCVAGLCASGAVVNCDDGNACTADSCNDVGLCVHEATAGACDDGNACTVGDHCAQGLCVYDGLADCDDGNVCTADSCSPASGCFSAALDGVVCDDGDPCTTGDSCVAGLCASGAVVNCDDGNACTADSCNDVGLCVHEAAAGDCDDGNACTVNDHCEGGVCMANQAPDCDDDNVCTTDSCDPVSGCVHLLNSVPCDDEDVCTTGDHCHLGECISAGTLVCNDNNLCTDDSCSPETGCTFTPNQAPCDDGNFCTQDDVCTAGACAPGQPIDCDDENVCTDDYCDFVQGCIHTFNSNQCNDADACTANEFCNEGSCGGGVPIVCDDENPCTDDTCDPATGCLYTNNGAPCDDGNACTDGDLCVDGQCGPGVDVVCDDNEVCTADSCDPAQGCVYAPITPCCGNGALEAGEECDDGNHAGGDGCSAQCVSEFQCTNPSGGSLEAENGTGQNKYYCYNPGDSTKTRAQKACESHFGIGNCCVITGGYQDQQYGQCGGGGGGSSIHWHWDNHPAGHCGPYYVVGDVVSPGWCGTILGNFL